MRKLSRSLALWLTVALGSGTFGWYAHDAAAHEPGWSSHVIKRPAERASVNSLPVVERPYRPLHVYGNTMRRRYYRQGAPAAHRTVTETSPATEQHGTAP